MREEEVSNQMAIKGAVVVTGASSGIGRACALRLELRPWDWPDLPAAGYPGFDALLVVREERAQTYPGPLPPPFNPTQSKP